MAAPTRRIRTKSILPLLVTVGVAFLTACGPDADAGEPGAEAASGASGAPPAETGDGDARAWEFADRWIESVGGMQAFHDFQTARYSLSTELYDAATGRMQRARPRYVTLAKTNNEQLSRIERWDWTGQSFIVQAFDGDTAWAYVNGEPAPPGQMDADQALYVSRDVFYWFSLPFKLRDPGVVLHYDGRNDDGLHVVRATFEEGVGSDIWWHLFEDDASWPVETRYQTGGTGSVQRLSFQDIREVDGYFYPVERVHVNDQDRVWKILRMTEVEINPPVPASAFTDPAASPWTATD
ncbi:MAG: hypothetical protein ACLFWG_09365 [Longimicrobiales bacterium]